jgi:hypothetical protein
MLLSDWQYWNALANVEANVGSNLGYQYLRSRYQNGGKQLLDNIAGDASLTFAGGGRQ